jgi:hypothetical protein
MEQRRRIRRKRFLGLNSARGSGDSCHDDENAWQPLTRRNQPVLERTYQAHDL